MGRGAVAGGLSGLAVVGSIIVYGAFTAPALTMAAIAPVPFPAEEGAPIESAAAVNDSAIVASVAAATAEPAKEDLAALAPAAPAVAAQTPAQDPAASSVIAFLGLEEEKAVIGAPDYALAAADAAQSADAPLQASAEDAPAPDDAALEAEVAQAPLHEGEIVDPPRLTSERDLPAAALVLADAAGPAAPVVAEAPAYLESLAAMQVAVTSSQPAVQPGQIALSAEIGAIQVAAAPAELTDALPAPTSPAAMIEPAPRADAGERALASAEVSLSSSRAFDLEPDARLGFAALVDPQISAPSTPEMNVDPKAAISAPADMLSAAPHARTPELVAPAVVAVLGAEPPAGFGLVSQPEEVSIISQNDRGRDAARLSVMTDEDMAWRRFAVAPPANPDNLPLLAIVIDEIGSYGAPVEDVAALSPMVTTSVIPSTQDSASIAEALRASGRELLVHMPMETYADFSAGPNAILKAMSDQEVRETARWNLSQFDGYVGVNNHLGSKATRDRRVMDALMVELSGRGLMFLDSRTTGKSVAAQAALDTGMLAARNSRFIDNELDVEAIMRELNAAAAQARRYGAAIALGNPHPQTVYAVKRWMELNDGKKVVVAPITHVAGVINAGAEEKVAGK